MVQCFVAECDHSYSKNQCSFFRLPFNIKTRRKWEQLCGRPTDCSNENSRICSCHFVGGRKSAAPSVFQWTEKKLTEFTDSHSDLKQEPEEKLVMCAALGNAMSLNPPGELERIANFKEEIREMDFNRLQTNQERTWIKPDQNVPERKCV